jgi:glyoxylase-like metal-dependent hydrolase (beta-lactamase superfamily II)/rhodanese-related sulfurtransferase
MLFRQLYDSKSSTYTYLLADPDTREAVLIDPVFEQVQRDEALVRELELKLRYTLDTHVHADHVTGAWVLKHKLGSRIVVSEGTGAKGADEYVKEGDVVEFGRYGLEVRETPGHTDGCVSYVTTDQSMAFTGDALLIRGAGRTDFQQGDARTLFHSVREKIFTLPDDTMLYPAHDYKGRTASTIWEEKTHNPRLGSERSEGDFVGYMQNLGLPHPKRIDEALPANLQCGRPEHGEVPEAPAWGPVVRTVAGIPEIDPDWVSEHRSQVRVVDVREKEEYDGELGHIDGAELVPLATLRDESAQWTADRPIVTVCRSGARSAQAAVILENQGFDKVANLSGGMIRWRAGGLPVAGPDTGRPPSS